MKRRMVALLLILLLVLTGCNAANDKLPSADSSTDISTEDSADRDTEKDELEIHVLKVGEADAILLVSDEFCGIIDSGKSTDCAYILDKLAELNVTRLDMMLITHFDKDHVGGAANILREIPTDTVFYPDYPGTTDAYLRFMNVVHEYQGAKQISNITTYTCGDAVLTIYPPEDPEKIKSSITDYANDYSLVSMLQYGECRFLFTGDIRELRIKMMLDSDTDFSCDWIKMPHHGRYADKLKKFLKACNPKIAVISTSEAEGIEKKTISCLKDRDITYFDTMKSDVVTVCNGTDIWMK